MAKQIKLSAPPRSIRPHHVLRSFNEAWKADDPRNVCPRTQSQFNLRPAFTGATTGGSVAVRKHGVRVKVESGNVAGLL